MRRSQAAIVLSGCCALMAACGGDGSGAPPLIVGVVVSVEGPWAAQAGQGAFVAVVDASSGSPITSADVTINGVRLPYQPASEDYEAVVGVPRGGSVTMAVSVGGRTYTASGSQATTFPVPTGPAPGTVWPSPCPNTVAWSPGSPQEGGSYLVLVLDAVNAAAPAFLAVEVPVRTNSYEVSPSQVPPGERLVVVGLESAAVQVTSAAPGSNLVMVGGTASPVTFSSATYSRIELFPSNQGLTPGQARQFRATGVACHSGPDVDLTEVAQWASSAPAVATTTTGPGAAGLVTAVGTGTTLVTVASEGITGRPGWKSGPSRSGTPA